MFAGYSDHDHICRPFRDWPWEINFLEIHCSVIKLSLLEINNHKARLFENCHGTQSFGDRPWEFGYGARPFGNQHRVFSYGA